MATRPPGRRSCAGPSRSRCASWPRTPAWRGAWWWARSRPRRPASASTSRPASTSTWSRPASSTRPWSPARRSRTPPRSPRTSSPPRRWWPTSPRRTPARAAWAAWAAWGWTCSSVGPGRPAAPEGGPSEGPLRRAARGAHRGGAISKPPRPLWTRDSAEFSRAIGFIDATFALALTLLVTTLEVDDASAWTSLDALWDAVGEQFVSFAVAFAVIAGYWLRHHRLIESFAAIDRVVII